LIAVRHTSAEYLLLPNVYSRIHMTTFCHSVKVSASRCFIRNIHI